LAIDLVVMLSPPEGGGRRVRSAFVGLGAALSTMVLFPGPPALAAGMSVSTTSLSSSALAVAAGQPVTLTGVVSGGPAGMPTGCVTFADLGGPALGTAVLQNGRASIVVTLAPGLHAITASYAGDMAFLPSLDEVTQRWGPAVDARVVLTASPNPAPTGTQVTLAATVDPAAGVGLTTGDVTFSDGATVLGTVRLGRPQPAGDRFDPVAALALSTLAPGAHAVTASFTGDGNVGAGASDALSLLIGQPMPTSTSLTAAPDPVAGDQVVGFTVGVTAQGASIFPTGTVTLLEDGAALGSGSLGSGGIAQLALSGLAPATHQIVASYGGDASFAPSDSAAVAQVVLGGGATRTSVGLTAAPDRPVFGQPLTVTASVSPQGPGRPTGTVSFANAGAALGAAVVAADGTASLTFQPPAGELSLSAAYGGDDTFASSVTPYAFGVLTLHAASTVSFASSPNPAVAGQPVTIVARVTAAPGSPVPTGLVAFIDGATRLGSAAVDQTGAATMIVTALPAGSHMVAAQYLGDGSYDSSNTASLVQTVGEAPVDDAGPRRRGLRPGPGA
jgi:hypothetical protein